MKNWIKWGILTLFMLKIIYSFGETIRVIYYCKIMKSSGYGCIPFESTGIAHEGGK